MQGLGTLCGDNALGRLLSAGERQEAGGQGVTGGGSVVLQWQSRFMWGKNGEAKQGVREMKGAAASIHFATGGEGVLHRGGEQAVAVLGREAVGSLKVEEDDKGSRLSGPRCWAQSTNGPEDLMGHCGEVGRDGLLRWQAKNKKGKSEIT
jgi:hypothetical protein